MLDYVNGFASSCLNCNIYSPCISIIFSVTMLWFSWGNEVKSQRNPQLHFLLKYNIQIPEHSKFCVCVWYFSLDTTCHHNLKQWTMLYLLTVIDYSVGYFHWNNFPDLRYVSHCYPYQRSLWVATQPRQKCSIPRNFQRQTCNVTVESLIFHYTA